VSLQVRGDEFAIRQTAGELFELARENKLADAHIYGVMLLTVYSRSHNVRRVIELFEEARTAKLKVGTVHCSHCVT
jgi:hypothetical protein